MAILADLSDKNLLKRIQALASLRLTGHLYCSLLGNQVLIYKVRFVREMGSWR